MSFTAKQLQQLTQTAIAAALAAGKIIRNRQHAKPEVRYKPTGSSEASSVVTEVDLLSQKTITDTLQACCEQYAIAMLAEETTDDLQRFEADTFWCIDPLDGTKAFIDQIHGYCVSIALVDLHGEPLIGVVYDPLKDDLYHAFKGSGSCLNDKPLVPPLPDKNRPLLLTTDHSFSNDTLYQKTKDRFHHMAIELGYSGGEIHWRTGAVLNACAILHDSNRCYFKYPRRQDTGGSLWDYAATACLFKQTGAFAGDIYGNSMQLNRPGSTFMNHRGILYAANNTTAEAIIKLYQELVT